MTRVWNLDNRILCCVSLLLGAAGAGGRYFKWNRVASVAFFSTALSLASLFAKWFFSNKPKKIQEPDPLLSSFKVVSSIGSFYTITINYDGLPVDLDDQKINDILLKTADRSADQFSCEIFYDLKKGSISEILGLKPKVIIVRMVPLVRSPPG